MISRSRHWVAGSALVAALGAIACESNKPQVSPPSRQEAAPPAKPEARPSAPEAKQLVMENEDESAHDGRWLYSRNCEGCHNKNGDGEGPTILALHQKARSFAQGGFAFGNTREAIFKTISAGMPGSSVMPSFKATLSDDERWKIAEFVLTLCPKVEEPAVGTVMKVEKTPAIARGLLPALGEKKPEWPRGLLIGFPEGMTFEYRTDDVRFLAVRQGEFADRQDWNDRGGAPLVPLGKPIYVCGDGDPGPTFALVYGAYYRPATARMLKTWDRGGSAGLVYQVREKTGALAATVSEVPTVEALSIGGSFTRSFELTAGEGSCTLAIAVAGRHTNAEWVRGMPAKWKIDRELSYGPLPQDGWIVAHGDEGFECVHIEAPDNAHVLQDVGRVRLLLPLFVQDGRRPPAKVKVTVVTTAEWTPEKLAELAKEIAR